MMARKDHTAIKTIIPRSTGACLIALSLLLLYALPAAAQKKNMIRIRAFDQQLKPVKNVEISINEKEYVALGNKGTAYIQLEESDLPLKSVKIKDEELEAASWNYNKGTVEIIIRKKNYRIIRCIVRDQNRTPIANVKVTFNGKRTITATTDNAGKFEIPLALDEAVPTANQLSIPDYKTVKFETGDNENTLTAEPHQMAAYTQERPKPKEFDLSRLDTIQSLTSFYAVFKNQTINDLNDEARHRVEGKFNHLVKELEDSIRNIHNAFNSSISDTSFITDDVKSLLGYASEESRVLMAQREEFDEKIQIIKEKLEGGIQNLDSTSRAGLLTDLSTLEQLLTQNDSIFLQNQEDYRAIINAIKEKYFNFQDLENKLTEMEAQRLEEQRVFTQWILAMLFIAVIFSILTILLITFSSRLRNQKKELVLMNAEVKRMNENLETLVTERTQSLAEAHKELDTFLYRASHDLRSPVCSIIGLCNIAAHVSSSNKEAKEILDKVVYTSSAMDKLLRKLSLIAEIHQPSNFAAVNLPGVIQKVRTLFDKSITDNNVRFTMDCPSDLIIRSYPNLIEAIIASLIENAIFYSVLKYEGDPTVSIKASVKEDQLEIIVYDNGIGINKKNSTKLFEMFFKGNENSKGNGLGLYIVQKSVQALHGTISLESELGQFTQFTITIPLQTFTQAQVVSNTLLVS